MNVNIKINRGKLGDEIKLISTHACTAQILCGEPAPCTIANANANLSDTDFYCRHLFGFYFDWDEIRDRMNVLVNAPLI